MKTHLEILSDFTDEALEGELADEELSRLLVATNFTESDSSGPETMGLLDTTSCGLKTKLECEENPESRKHIRQRSCERRTWQRAAYGEPFLHSEHTVSPYALTTTTTTT